MRTLSTKKTVAVIAAGAITLSVSGVAYAYWTTTGSGSGSATTADPTGVLTVAQTNAGETALTPMFPGDSPQTVTGLITNANAETNFVRSVTVTIAGVQKAGAAAVGCDRSDYLLGGAVATADGVTLPFGGTAGVQLAKDATQAFSTSLQFNNKASAQDACKGATVTLSFTTNSA